MEVTSWHLQTPMVSTLWTKELHLPLSGISSVLVLCLPYAHCCLFSLSFSILLSSLPDWTPKRSPFLGLSEFKQGDMKTSSVGWVTIRLTSTLKLNEPLTETVLLNIVTSYWMRNLAIVPDSSNFLLICWLSHVQWRTCCSLEISLKNQSSVSYC